MQKGGEQPVSTESTAESGRDPRPPGRWESILQAALSLFHHRGYHATSVQDLADAVGLQKASLYHYFRSKEDLLFPLMQRALSGHLADIREIARAPGAPGEKLEMAIAAHVGRITDSGILMQVYMSESRHLRPKERAKITAMADEYRLTLKEIVRQGLEEGQFGGADAAMATFAILGACNWLPQWYRPDGEKSPEEVAREFIGLFTRGLAPNDPGPR